jgi:hypothetical protein
VSQIKKIIAKLQKKPTPKDVTWDELIKVLNHFGFKALPEGKTGGSRRKFINKNKMIISLHEPHPRKELKKYQIDQVLDTLKEERLI